MNRFTCKVWDDKEKTMLDVSMVGESCFMTGNPWKFGDGEPYDTLLWKITNSMTVIQFTGRTDSKDKEIFEGDILMARGEKGTVKWETDRFIVYSNALGMDVYYPLHSYSSDELVILGNIYTGEEQEVLYGATPNETA